MEISDQEIWLRAYCAAIKSCQPTSYPSENHKYATTIAFLAKEAFSDQFDLIDNSDKDE